MSGSGLAMHGVIKLLGVDDLLRAYEYEWWFWPVLAVSIPGLWLSLRWLKAKYPDRPDEPTPEPEDHWL